MRRRRLCWDDATARVQGTPTVLVFPENSGSNAFRLDQVALWVREVGCRVLILSYRGYGESDGEQACRGTSCS